MHQKLFEKLSINTFLLQFYGHLARGFFTESEDKEIHATIEENIDRLLLMKGLDWDGRYDLVLQLISKTEKFLENAKSYNSFKQIGKDLDIVNYMRESQDEFIISGISLVHMQKIFDISIPLKNGYMLHDSYSGYPEKNLYRYHIDCLDYAHSAAHFYNEAYDYYNHFKTVDYSVDLTRAKFFEHKRIQSKEEVMFRNFREAYINIIFFMESFINSVGFDAYLKKIGKNQDEENKLRGVENVTKKGNEQFSTLKQRLTNIPKILNSCNLDTSKEPFKSYLQNNVELRNKYVHSSPYKDHVQVGLIEWKQKCDLLIATDCYEVLNSFWKACYPRKTFPKIIFNTFWGNSFKGHQGKSIVLD
jgi:hypothetical protein